MAEPDLAVNRAMLYRRGVCWLLLLAPLFFLTYGQVNQFTASRVGVRSMVFNWEHAIPFLPWTIVPYWSIDLLYGLSLFICTARQEQTRHAWRLVAASLVACTGFLLFPLKFTFMRPDVQGVFGWFFHQLEQFDLPYNQAPSLHIILAWILWLRFREHLHGLMRVVCAGWFLLIGVSVLTTWQHHFIDVISGLIVGVLVSYLVPVSGRWCWQRPGEQALRLAAKYCAASILFALVGTVIPYGYFLFWPALALLVVALGYAGLGTAIFQKSSTGTLSLSARLVLWPYLTGAALSRAWFSRHLAHSNVVCDGVALGGFPARGRKVPQAAVLDLTAEFHKCRSQPQDWLSHPLMDLVAPDEPTLRHAVSQLEQLHQAHGSVMVCCALGLSRSATVVAAWLLTRAHVSSVEQAVNLIKCQRPQVVFTPAHIALLEHYRATQLREIQCQTLC
jgi:protein-tyrosine phosphatase